MMPGGGATELPFLYRSFDSLYSFCFSSFLASLAGIIFDSDGTLRTAKSLFAVLGVPRVSLDIDFSLLFFPELNNSFLPKFSMSR